jgi:hypothetical protein
VIDAQILDSAAKKGTIDLRSSLPFSSSFVVTQFDDLVV